MCIHIYQVMKLEPLLQVRSSTKPGMTQVPSPAPWSATLSPKVNLPGCLVKVNCMQMTFGPCLVQISSCFPSQSRGSRKPGTPPCGSVGPVFAHASTRSCKGLTPVECSELFWCARWRMTGLSWRSGFESCQLRAVYSSRPEWPGGSVN